VTKLPKALALISVMTTTYGGASLAAEDAASDVSVAKDLTAVIALQGLPCGQVVSASQQGADDYIAKCENGNRYRVFTNAEGRVIATRPTRRAANSRNGPMRLMWVTVPMCHGQVCSLTHQVRTGHFGRLRISTDAQNCNRPAAYILYFEQFRHAVLFERTLRMPSKTRDHDAHQDTRK